MWRTTLKSLLAHKLRLGSTFLAVMLGVAFVAGTLVLGDTLNRTFDRLFAEVTAGIDLSVRSEAAFEERGAGADREPLPEALLAAVLAVDGVRAAEGSVGGYAQLVDKEGGAISPQAPTFGTNFSVNEELTPLSIREGRRPERAGEVAIDAGTAADHDFAVGDTVKILFQGPARTFTIVGIAGFGEADNLAGATLAAFDIATAQEVLGREGVFDSIDVVVDDGVAAGDVKARIDAVLPAGYEAVTGQKVADENAAAVKRGLGFFSRFLLVFALISLFVGSFIIFNTFSIIVAQRAREMALLRAVGATRRQVTRSVLAEAAIVGLAASAAGIGVGVLVAVGLTAMLGALGVDLPDSGTVFLPRTAWVCVLLGVGVTGVASLAPARRAGRVAPVAALRDTVVEPAHSMRRRLLAGSVALAAGTAMLGGGLFGDVDNALLLVGLGAAVVFVAVSMLSPLVSRSLASAIGAPLPRLFGVPGRLARDNAMRNPRRTASTASALMIGLGLVTTVTVLATSIKASIGDLIDKTIKADFVLQSDNFQGVSPELARQLTDERAIAAAAGFRGGEFRVDGDRKNLGGVDPAGIGRVIDVDLRSGSLDSLARGAVLVEENEAESRGWEVGDTIEMEFARTGIRTVPVGGTFAQNQFLGDYVVSLDFVDANFTNPLDFVVAVKAADNVDVATAREAVERVAADFPNVEVRDQAEFKQNQEDQVNQLLGLVYALLALAIVIALIGIMNTMALSIFERTRELGLVRAVGMTRRQVRRMIRWESVVVSVLGAAIGLAIGVAFGAALVKALESEGIEQLRLPFGTLALFMVVAGVAGMVAAILPARRAARLDVLAAIATE